MMHLGINFWRILVRFGTYVVAKIDPKSGRKNKAKMEAKKKQQIGQWNPKNGDRGLQPANNPQARPPGEGGDPKASGGRHQAMRSLQ